MVFLLLLTALWLALVATRFRTSRVILIGGLVVVAAAAFGLIARGDLEPKDLGLSAPRSWALTLGLSVGWLVIMLVYTQVADRTAARFFARPPTLEMFRAIQESRLKLVAGIVIAWVLGGFLEELALRGIVLQTTEAFLASLGLGLAAVVIAVAAAATGGLVIHLYQGLRAAFIVTQLSALFGALFVISGGNLWTVVLCHGLYDTVAFIRFANRSSKYSNLDSPPDYRDAEA
jgi:membrane protease YdiL (CAAX protease family)